MAFVQSFPLFSVPTLLPSVAPRRKAFLITAAVKTKRRVRNPAAASRSRKTSPLAAPSRRTSSQRSTSLTSEGALQLPDDLLSHSLLTPEEEQNLIDEIQFIRDLESTRALLAADDVDPSNEALAQALTITPIQLSERHMRAIQARNRLVTANIRLVYSIAKVVHRMDVRSGKYQHTEGTNASERLSRKDAIGVSSSDLVQEGCIALMRAAERYDSRTETRFSTYASRAIWSACRRAAVPASCIVTLPERLRRAVRRKRIAASAQPTIDVDAKRIDEDDEGSSGTGEAALSKTSEYTPTHLVNLAERHLTSGVSLDEPVPSGITSSGSSRQPTRGDTLQCEQPSPEAFVTRELMREEVRTACYENLPQRLAEILVLRFGLNEQPPMPAKEIAERNGISTVRVSQIVSEARRMMRESAPQLELLMHEL